MIKNSALEIFKGIITIAKVDNKVYETVLPLINYFFEKKVVKKDYYRNLFNKAFNPDKAKEVLSNEDKNFFFSCIVLVASFDGLSKKEEDLIYYYTKALEFPESSLQEIIEQVKSELDREKDKDSLQWLIRTIKNYINFFEIGFTPFEGFYSMRLLHFLTNNRSSEIIGFLAKIFNEPYPVEVNSDNVFAISSKDQINQITQEIKENSYHVFSREIDSDICNNIIDFARKTPCYPSLANQEHFDNITGKRIVEKVLYDYDKPLARRYDFDIQDIIENIDIQKIVSDSIFLQVAQDYFQAKPVLNMVSMWWSCDFQGEPSRYTGQVYHIDIDRAKFLNFFIYLTDVDSENGSHIYIKGTHNHKPLNLLIDKRMTDQELEDVYDNDDFIEITGKQGTVFVGDTKAYHKGNPLKKGERLVLQLDFSTDRFGENCPQLNINEKFSKSFLDTKEKYSYTFQNYLK